MHFKNIFQNQKETGGLFKLAILLMKIYSKDNRDFNQLIDCIGQFFQIRDDLANLCSKEYADSKSYCEDLTEGKFSYPVIHTIKYSGNKDLGDQLLGKIK
jgi:geranylgeranyl diphosphate synthase type 3